MTILVILVLTGFVLWALLGNRIVAEPSGPSALMFFGYQVVSAVGFLLTCVLGFRPSTEISVSGPTVTIVQQRTVLRIRRQDVADIETVPALDFHRHHRRFAVVQAFSDRSADEFVVIRTRDLVVGLGLPAGRRESVLSALKPENETESRLARVAI